MLAIPRPWQPLANGAMCDFAALTVEVRLSFALCRVEIHAKSLCHVSIGLGYKALLLTLVSSSSSPRREECSDNHYAVTQQHDPLSKAIAIPRNFLQSTVLCLEHLRHAVAIFSSEIIAFVMHLHAPYFS